MEQISPKYMIALIKKIKTELTWHYSLSDIRAYLERWIVEYDSFNQNFGIIVRDNGDIDVDKTLQNIDDETLLKIAIDLELDTPDFLPSIPIFKNEIKSSYKTASKTFELACKKVETEPDTAVSLANAALESILKEILKDDKKNEGTYNSRHTLGKLTEDFLRAFNSFPSQSIPSDIRQIGSSLLSCCNAIENLRSDKTLVAHGKTDGELVIEDPAAALFIVNAVTTIGLFLFKQYQKRSPVNQEESEMEFVF